MDFDASLTDQVPYHSNCFTRIIFSSKEYLLQNNQVNSPILTKLFLQNQPQCILWWVQFHRPLGKQRFAQGKRIAICYLTLPWASFCYTNGTATTILLSPMRKKERTGSGHRLAGKYFIFVKGKQLVQENYYLV